MVTSVKFVSICVIRDKKNHRRKIILAMVTKIYYNSALTAKTMLGGITRLLMTR